MRRIIILLLALSMISVANAQQKLDLRSHQILNNIRQLQKQGASLTETWAKKREARRKKGGVQDVDPMEPVLSADGRSIQSFIITRDNKTLSELRSLGVELMTTAANISTCTIPLDRMDEVIALTGVERIQFGRLLHLHNDIARELTNVDALHTYSAHGMQPFTGRGVIYGTIDSGIDFNHAAFRNSDGSSRILYAYLPSQKEPLEGGEPYDDHPGFTYSSEYIPNLTSDTDVTAHGTHTMATGAGGKNGSEKFYGMAPEADIIAVGTPTLSDVNIISGLTFMSSKAKELGRPISINLSMGNNNGPHDGSDPFSCLIDAVGSNPGVIISISAGNEGNNNMYLNNEGNENTISTLIHNTDSENMYEYKDITVTTWSRHTQGKYSVRLSVIEIATDGSLTRHYLNQQLYPADENNINKVELTPENCPKYIVEGGIDMSGTTTNGRYNIEISSDGLKLKSNMILSMTIYCEEGCEMEAWASDPIEFSSGKIEGLVDGTPDGSYNNMATGKNVLSVGAYVSRFDWRNYENKRYYYDDMEVGEYADFSSYGTNYLGNSYPTMSAPGQMLASASSIYHPSDLDDENEWSIMQWTKDKYPGRTEPYVLKQGTSMACPVTAGTIALWLQANPTLTIDDIREVLANTCVNDQYTEATPIRFGYGKLDALAGLEYILANKPYNPTAVSTTSRTRNSEVIYNLAGQRVSPRHHGLIIKGGKKVVM